MSPEGPIRSIAIAAALASLGVVPARAGQSRALLGVTVTVAPSCSVALTSTEPPIVLCTPQTAWSASTRPLARTLDPRADEPAIRTTRYLTITY